MALDDPNASLVFYAQGLLNWLTDNNFCQRCGSKLKTMDGGNRQQCTHSDCGHEVFPRINPAVIVLLTHGHQCLLANAHRFKGDIPMFSCLAGYMETGEDFEQTLRREIFEEVGLELGEISYKGNQPWPFPQSLMIGFHAESKTQAMTFHDGEIASARWFTAEELKDAVLNREVLLPTPKSISYYLIEDWFETHHQTPLLEILEQANDNS
jgi:NAD+ diphosphatase